MHTWHTLTTRQHVREVFITGATSMLGAALVQRLLREGVRVHALVRTPDQANQMRAMGVSPVVGNLARLEVDGCRLALTCCDAVIHLAATMDEQAPQRLFETNVRGTKTLMRGAQAAGVGRFLLVSTLATLSAALQTPLHEPTPDLRPSHYVMSRFLAEEIVFSGYHQGVPSIVLNLATIVPPTLTQHSALRAWLASQPIPHDAGTRRVHLLTLETAVEAIWQALIRGRPGQRYVISNAEQTLAFDMLIPLMLSARRNGGGLLAPHDHPPLLHTTTLDHGDALGLTYDAPVLALDTLRGERWLFDESVVMPWRS
ncbi:NAD-dependent epimerase/dehydratase family protein [Ardenticatena maritima]|nr:NAD-dependent epimerase/dehydratase family protein [Ardenticatena maritima]